ncbi:uncharacterized protein EDB91DRAFT_1261638 [Suillus paluster]|uniref:uncharacterized protein n=1 Tax=Suillus paluster TaxID=48578 RepID=UPI001B8871BC|nr:uncharacterized protein EDB91DRAFT_1261638 [Suillus paluster]KAG1756665.1 hypothetical protein EDB91DRAFT_1261638 [Suillus paluster]
MSPLTKAWSLIVVLAAAAIVPRGAFAQTSNATCVSGFDWMNNTLQQNPCTVAAYLESVCWGGDFSIYPLPAGTHYAAPEVTEANACECSTVVYSLISACGDCQNRTFLRYPYNIPSGTLVPNWAYLNVTSGSGTFDATLAQADGDSPESSATTAQSTGTATHSTTVSGSLTTPPTTATGSSATSNVGAIAGGVIGGVVGLAAIVGLAAWFFVKRRRSSKAPSAAFSDIGGGPGYTQSVYSANPHPFPMQSQMTQQPRLYDPADPTTFPTSPPSPTVLTTSSNIYQNPSIPSHVFSQQSRPGQYTGTPEI